MYRVFRDFEQWNSVLLGGGENRIYLETVEQVQFLNNLTPRSVRFDQTRQEKDMRVQAQRLQEGEHELFTATHLDPKIFKVTGRNNLKCGWTGVSVFTQ
jgi:hypothetical protein